MKTLKSGLSVLCVAALLIGCDSSSSSSSETTPLTTTVTDTPIDVLVYGDREVRQCESDGISPEASAQILINAGIDVLQSTCGLRTGVAFPDVCGGATADILVHKIRSVNLADAEQLGFQEISTLVDAAAGTSYELVDCN